MGRRYCGPYPSVPLHCFPSSSRVLRSNHMPVIHSIFTSSIMVRPIQLAKSHSPPVLMRYSRLFSQASNLGRIEYRYILPPVVEHAYAKQGETALLSDSSITFGCIPLTIARMSEFFRTFLLKTGAIDRHGFNYELRLLKKVHVR